ncbi:MAG TPA: AMP-binding protein [Actinophytocola sp.]|uniref:AMP-binding protein n=1 Tax=Actinophytocola sp. TaxID=1872138 RepID=UPI002DBC78DB|nr:AMP-binding protein [Actinophytocola sp.]HEU5469547.1 AMP-binding protein [Actinophytocola sp.]
MTGLRRHGDRLAVVTPDGAALTHARLADRVAEVAARLGPGRRLVQVAAANELDPLITYLAALAAGHPVLLAAPDSSTHWDTLIRTYDPDVVLDRDSGGEWRLADRRPGSAHQLHPDLAVLLSTSGSTGSPKLVRLSAPNLWSNAEAIADYLDIRDTDRAAATLPMHYCYGLSVINSNLLRGAALLLSGDSVLEERFWAMFRENGGTSLHGVPYTFDLLERVGFAGLELPTLRYVTQAGGALGAQRVRQYAELGRRRGWRFFVMYGQTEATARMAYLPPELAAAHPAAIGVPISGGSFEILPSDVPDQGELLYRGPNVMLGYAESPADLALGRTVDALRTGDIARRTPDGLYEVVGRTSRFVKLFGLRIDLRQAERVLAGAGAEVACTGTDDALVVAVQRAGVVEVRAAARRRLGLPASHVRVLPVDTIPRLPNGKVDYPAIRRLAADPPAESERGRSVHERFAAVLGRAAIDDDATFVSLGGDSLCYVQMSIEIERALGYVPRNWHLTPVGELDRLAPRARSRPVRTATVETNIVLRAVAIVLVVGTHAYLFEVLGGAHLLLMVAGWSFARFCLSRDTGTARGILRSAVRIAIPSMVWLGWRVFETTDVTWANVLLVNTYARTGAGGYWFVEALVQTLLLFAVLFAIPPVRRWERRHGFGFALLCLGAALLVNLTAHDTPAYPERAMATHGVLWFFVLGWLAYRAEGPVRKLIVAGIAALLVPGYFGEPIRDAVVLLGLVILVFVPQLRLPRVLVLVLAPVASASLAIYLTHYAVLDLTLHRMPPIAVVGLGLAVGLLVWAVVDRNITFLRPRRPNLILTGYIPDVGVTRARADRGRRSRRSLPRPGPARGGHQLRGVRARR